MKTVTYGDGRLTFRVPDEWKRRTGPDGEAIYEAKGKGAGQLEVYVVAVESETGTGHDALLHVAAAGAHPEDPPGQILPSGYAFRRFTRFEATGGPLRIVHWWHLAAAVEGTVRLAVFAYTQGDEADDPAPGILEREIVRARFAGAAAPGHSADEGDDLADVTATGIPDTAKGEATARRPWWKLW